MLMGGVIKEIKEIFHRRGKTAVSCEDRLKQLVNEAL